MKKSGLLTMALFASALSLGLLLGPPTVAAAGPIEAAWNMEQVGTGFWINPITGKEEVDPGPYSKMGPWPHTDGRYMYSGCYDPAPLAPNAGADRCFMVIDLKDHDQPMRLATVYSYDLVESPSPPAGHIVWTPTYAFPNLPVHVPCKVEWNDPGIKAGTTKPTCWDPGWNTHNHYAMLGPGKVLAVNQERYRGGSRLQANYHGVKFYDVSDPAHPKFLSYWEAPVSPAVSPPDPVTGVWPDAGGTHHFNFGARYLYLGTEYKGFIGKILVILDVKDPRHPVEAGKWWIPGQKVGKPPLGEDDQRNWVQQSSFSNPIIRITAPDPMDPTKTKLMYTKHVGMHYVSIQGNRAYLSYHQAGLVILDVTDPRDPEGLARLDYLKPDTLGTDDPGTPDNAECKAAAKYYWKLADEVPAACGNTHATKRVPGHGDNLLIISDEYFSCPWGHVRLVDISDETKPVILSHFLTDQNMACNPNTPNAAADPTRFPRRGPSSHLGNAWGSDLYLMAWYGMGLRAIDISNPNYPVEVGFFEYEINRNNPTYAGSDTYDVLFGPGNFLYLSDGTSGLRVLKYTGRGAPAE